MWSHLRQQKYFKQQGTSEVQWARRFFVQVRALREVDDLSRELRSRLAREGIDPAQPKSPWGQHELPLVLKVCLLFYLKSIRFGGIRMMRRLGA